MTPVMEWASYSFSKAHYNHLQFLNWDPSSFLPYSITEWITFTVRWTGLFYMVAMLGYLWCELNHSCLPPSYQGKGLLPSWLEFLSDCLSQAVIVYVNISSISTCRSSPSCSCSGEFTDCLHLPFDSFQFNELRRVFRISSETPVPSSSLSLLWWWSGVCRGGASLLMKKCLYPVVPFFIIIKFNVYVDLLQNRWNKLSSRLYCWEFVIIEIKTSSLSNAETITQYKVWYQHLLKEGKLFFVTYILG